MAPKPHQLAHRVSVALAAVPVVFFAAFFAYPLLSILWRGLAPGGSLELGVLGDVLGDGRTWEIAWFTFWQAAVSTVLTVAAGLPAAHVFARYQFRGKRLARAAVTVPFVLPTVVVATAFLTLLGPEGPLGIDLRRTIWAVLVAHVFFNLAVVIRTVGGAWAVLDPRPEEAARVLGASPLRAFLSVTLRRLLPSIAAASALVFLFTFTSFGVILILGGPALATLEVETYVQTVTFLNLDVAAILALLQLTAVVSLLVVQRLVVSRREREERLRAERTVARPPRGWRQRLWVGGNLTALAVFLGLPVVVLVERSFRVGDGYGLAWWRALGHSGRGSTLFVTPWEAVANSLTSALAAMLLALLVGGLAAVVIGYGRGGAAHGLDAVLMLPLGVSAVTIGFGFLIALDTPPLDLRTSPWLVPIAHALVAIPFVIRILVPSIRSVEGRLRHAAATLGASPWQAWRTVDLPLVGRSLAVAAGFAFAISMGEFGATTFIARPDRPTVPVAIYRFLGRPGAENHGQALAMSVILMVVTTLAVLAIERFRVGEVGDF
jgi:thiamine transport system permease protein